MPAGPLTIRHLSPVSSWVNKPAGQRVSSLSIFHFLLFAGVNQLHFLHQVAGISVFVNDK